MRTVSVAAALALSFAACSGSRHVDPNPAPSLASNATIDMAGQWVVTARALVNTNTSDTDALRVGSVVEIGRLGGGYVLTAVQLDSTTNAPAYQNDIEDGTGFALSWYQNAGDGASMSFGYGWDRLATGAGALPDFLAYGVRVVPVNENALVGFEARRVQEAGGSRFEWVVQIQFARAP